VAKYEGGDVNFEVEADSDVPVNWKFALETVE